MSSNPVDSAEVVQLLCGTSDPSRKGSPCFQGLTEDVLYRICEWLSARDILSLRRTNRWFKALTQAAGIWIFKCRILKIPFPILQVPTTFYYQLFRSVIPEEFVCRNLYYEKNWRRTNPICVPATFHGMGQTIDVKILPGGHYIVCLAKDPSSYLHAVILWDLGDVDHPVPLLLYAFHGPIYKFDAIFAWVGADISIVLATAEDFLPCVGIKRVSVHYIPLRHIPLYTGLSDGSKNFLSGSTYGNLWYQHNTKYEIDILSLSYCGSEPVLFMVHRPSVVLVHYLLQKKDGRLKLPPLHDSPTNICAIKVLPMQDSVLVARVAVARDRIPDFFLEMYQYPIPDSEHNKNFAIPIETQRINARGLDAFYFSNADSAWFMNINDTEGRLPGPMSMIPPPISCFATTNNPRGFVHTLLKPVFIPGFYTTAPLTKEKLPRYEYHLPFARPTRLSWTSNFARPVVLPGAFRSIVLMYLPNQTPPSERRPRCREPFQVARMTVYSTQDPEYEFAMPYSTGYEQRTLPLPPTGISSMKDDKPVKRHLQTLHTEFVEEDTLPFEERSLRLPDIPMEIAESMMHGTTAVAFDEICGRMCITTNGSHDVHVLDYGNMTPEWQTAYNQIEEVDDVEDVEME
ncbi:hypothetical protein M422DRAFT_24966 [Sphaerobolus stellatus SS14]|nr:hypothetical protein M422DRAFT_24966 [Sphaerobolus stellatus SS14]